MNVRRFVCGIVATLFTASATQALPTMYAIGNGNVLYKVNPATGAVISVGSATTVDTWSDSGAAFLDGKLYVTNAVQNGNFNFGTVNLSTGAFNFISNQNSPNFLGLAADQADDRLYTVSLNPTFGVNDVLQSVTPDGVSTPIGNGTGISPYTAGLAYNGVTKTLYDITQYGNLYTVNTTTGVATLIGNDGFNNQVSFASLSFDNQVLYLDTFNDLVASSGELYTLNTSTAAATLVGSNGSVGLEAIAVQPVPEPASSLTGILACGLLGRSRRARKL